MQFDIYVFPELFHDFAGQSLVARAIKKIISIKAHQMRTGRPTTTKPWMAGPTAGSGDGAMIEPCESGQADSHEREAIRRKEDGVILLSASGKQFKAS